MTQDLKSINMLNKTNGDIKGHTFSIRFTKDEGKNHTDHSAFSAFSNLELLLFIHVIPRVKFWNPDWTILHPGTKWSQRA